MDEQEYRKQVRRRGVATLSMFALGAAILAEQGEAPGPGAGASPTAPVAGRAPPAVHAAASASAPAAHVRDAIYRPFIGAAPLSWPDGRYPEDEPDSLRPCVPSRALRSTFLTSNWSMQ